MKNILKWRLTSLALLIAATSPVAAQTSSTQSWHAQTLGQALGYMLIFAAVGIAAAVIGYRVFDKCTPGNLNKEIIENKNVAAAIIAGAVILGVCVIIAAAMMS